MSEEIFTIGDKPIYPEKIYWVSQVKTYPPDNESNWSYGFDIKYLDGSHDYFKWPMYLSHFHDKVAFKHEQFKKLEHKIKNYLFSDNRFKKYFLGSSYVSDKSIEIFAKYLIIILKYGYIKEDTAEMLNIDNQPFSDVPNAYKNVWDLEQAAYQFWHAFKHELPEVNEGAIKEANYKRARQIHDRLLDLLLPGWYKIPLDKE